MSIAPIMSEEIRYSVMYIGMINCKDVSFVSSYTVHHDLDSLRKQAWLNHRFNHKDIKTSKFGDPNERSTYNDLTVEQISEMMLGHGLKCTEKKLILRWGAVFHGHKLWKDVDSDVNLIRREPFRERASENRV